MSVRWRLMRPGDIDECVDIVATHPVAGPRYGAAIIHLSSAWSRILASDACTLVVFEEAEPCPRRIAGVGVAVFVQDEFIRQLKREPFWIGPQLARRVAGDDSPILSGAELREGNSSGGLTLVCWEGLLHPALNGRSDLQRALATSFIENYRGYFLKEVISSQPDTPERLRWTLDTGGFLWDVAKGQYAEQAPEDLAQIVTRPQVVGATPALEAGRPGTWIGALFDYCRPEIGFSRAEQRLLAAALSDEWRTDEDLAPLLGVSASTIKKMWLSIYGRAATSLRARRLGNIDDAELGRDGPTLRRGKEKRRQLLAYLYEHPEELRPISRGRLQQTANAAFRMRRWTR